MCSTLYYNPSDNQSEKSHLINSCATGAFKVKYRPDEDWDFHVDSPFRSVDLSLSLPHYRARHQPVEHRLNMFVGCDAEPAKVKVCRNQPRVKFHLEIQAGTSDVTVWLPSDFRGQIHHSGRALFSAGFTNHIMRNASINEQDLSEDYAEDCVVVITLGRITFRMWDTLARAPENGPRETLKRLFTSRRKVTDNTMNWDFLLED